MFKRSLNCGVHPQLLRPQSPVLTVIIFILFFPGENSCFILFSFMFYEFELIVYINLSQLYFVGRLFRNFDCPEIF